MDIDKYRRNVLHGIFLLIQMHQSLIFGEESQNMVYNSLCLCYNILEYYY